MPTRGLSLLGFMDQTEAVARLRNTCVLGDNSDLALQGEWQRARAKLGSPTPNAGQPDFQPIPTIGQAHVAQLIQQPWFQNAMRSTLAGAVFHMVELAPLLALQIDVDVVRAEQLAGVATPDPLELFNICLPLSLSSEQFQGDGGQNSILLRSRSLNLGAITAGLMQTPAGDFMGIQLGTRIPLMHVVKYNGRCYLHNGFHRAAGLCMRGVRYVPCVVRDVADVASIGLIPGQTFGVTLLESPDPPTVGHFCLDRAYEVTLKVFTRTIHVSWAEYSTTQD